MAIEKQANYKVLLSYFKRKSYRSLHLIYLLHILAGVFKMIIVSYLTKNTRKSFLFQILFLLILSRGDYLFPMNVECIEA